MKVFELVHNKNLQFYLESRSSMKKVKPFYIFSVNDSVHCLHRVQIIIPIFLTLVGTIDFQFLLSAKNLERNAFCSAEHAQ